ncbi:hypothetical protein EDB80DRAFT_270412 [Ilyonectria destructans]|nr:hypothetical protein EDB80DRAFT_270412 [Ilyonectria destructans]
METSTSPLSSIRSMSDLSAFNTPSPSPELQANTDTGIGRERRNGTEKLNLVWRYIVDEMNWSIGDFVHTLCTSEGQANTRRKTAFARVAYQDLAVLDACIGRSGGPGTAESRGHLIEYLDIGAIELGKEVASLARFKPFHRSQEAEAALPTDQMQSNKLSNKSIKYSKILFQIKQIQNTGFEITFDIFDT